MKKMMAAILAACLLLTGCAASVNLFSVFDKLGPDFHGSYSNFRIAGGGGKDVYDDDEKICSWFESISVEEITAQPELDDDASAVTISFDKLHGKQQYFYTEVTEEKEVTIQYKMQIEEGRLKLVLIHDKDELQVLAEIGAGEDVDDLLDMTFSEGDYRLLLVGDEALHGTAELSLNLPDSYNEGNGL